MDKEYGVLSLMQYFDDIEATLHVEWLSGVIDHRSSVVREVGHLILGNINCCTDQEIDRVY